MDNRRIINSAEDFLKAAGIPISPLLTEEDVMKWTNKMLYSSLLSDWPEHDEQIISSEFKRRTKLRILDIDKNLTGLDADLTNGCLEDSWSEPNKYNVKEVLAKQKRLGRALTNEEVKKFERK